MDFYRVGSEKHMGNVTGLGASYQDGARWNKAGSPVLYLAISPGVAMLEMATYIQSPRLVPPNYGLGHLSASITDEDIEVLSLDDLPIDWDSYPYPSSTQEIGSEFLNKRKKFALIVPTTTVPGRLEKLAVVNPLHSAISTLKLISIQKNIYSERMFTTL